MALRRRLLLFLSVCFPPAAAPVGAEAGERGACIGKLLILLFPQPTQKISAGLVCRHPFLSRKEKNKSFVCRHFSPFLSAIPGESSVGRRGRKRRRKKNTIGSLMAERPSLVCSGYERWVLPTPSHLFAFLSAKWMLPLAVIVVPRPSLKEPTKSNLTQSLHLVSGRKVSKVRLFF